MKTTFKTAIFLTALAIFLLLGGEYFPGRNGLVVAIIVAALMNIISYFYSDRIALGLHRARRVTTGQLLQLYRTVERLTRRAGETHQYSSARHLNAGELKIEFRRI
jgi:heat shock protein HtpX